MDHTGRVDGTLPREGVLVLADGTEIALQLPPPGDVLGDQLRAGVYEVPPAHRLALELIDETSVVLDCGAHIGTFAVPAARKGAHVVAVEPNPTNVAALTANVLDGDVVVLEAAVGAGRGSVRFVDDGAWGRVVDRRQRGARAVRSIGATELIEVLGRPPDVVKIDVEGYELEAIEGLAPLLAARPPMVFECNAYALDLRGRTASALLRSVQDLGYRLYQIETLDRLVEKDDAVFQARCYVDCLAVAELPPRLSHWQVLPRPSPDSIAIDVLAQAHDPLPMVRRWLGRALAMAPPELHRHPDVAAGLDLLRHDPDRQVRRAARSTARRHPRR